MYPAHFEYRRAGSVDEAIRLLGEHDDARLLAGGHSLIPMMKLRLTQPATLVDIGRIDALQGICRSELGVAVGSLATHSEIADSELLKERCPLLAEAAGKIGDPAVRNKGTIGGNIAHADPASDLPAVLVAVGATVHLQGPGGKRQVPASDFFVDLLTTALAAGELITGIEVPLRNPPTGSAYLKVEHPASGYAVCGAAALVTMSGNTCAGASLCFNGVTVTPTDAKAVAEALVGTPADDDAIERAVDDNLEIVDPLGDLHASGDYRAALAATYGKRALKLARNRALA